MADKKNSQPKESPGPATGGGLPTTDPSFANQTNSAPKEQKPDSKSDLTRKR